MSSYIQSQTYHMTTNFNKCTHTKLLCKEPSEDTLVRPHPAARIPHWALMQPGQFFCGGRRILSL